MSSDNPLLPPDLEIDWKTPEMFGWQSYNHPETTRWGTGLGRGTGCGSGWALMGPSIEGVWGREMRYVGVGWTGLELKDGGLQFFLDLQKIPVCVRAILERRRAREMAHRWSIQGQPKYILRTSCYLCVLCKPQLPFL